MTSLPVSIGIAGIGNVGSEVVRQLIKHKEYKKSFTIKAVSYRNKKKKRNFIPKGISYYSDAKKLAQDENCLLYTSPSPRDKRQSRMPSSA